jgi:hypothetical protein
VVFRDLSIIHLPMRWRGRWLDEDWAGKFGICHGFALEKDFKAGTLGRVAPQERSDECLDVWGNHLGWILARTRLMMRVLVGKLDSLGVFDLL